jgi:hypothetical protein
MPILLVVLDFVILVLGLPVLGLLVSHSLVLVLVRARGIGTSLFSGQGRLA